MANVVYNNFKTASLSGAINFMTGIKVMLISGGYIPNIDTHITTGDVRAFQVTGVGYVDGGLPLSGVTLTTNTTSDLGVFDATDSFWSGATFAASGAVLYKSGSPAWLVGYLDFGASNSVTNGVFTIQWNSSGILNAS